MPKRKTSTIDDTVAPAPKRLTRHNVAKLEHNASSEASDKPIHAWATSLDCSTSTPATGIMPSPQPNDERRRSGRPTKPSTKIAGAEANRSDKSSSKASVTGSRKSGSAKSVSKSSLDTRSTKGDKPPSIRPSDPNFDQALEDSRIHSIHDSEKPKNYQAILESLQRTRASASPVSDRGFEAFVYANETCYTEGQVKQQVMPKLLGEANGTRRYPGSSNLLFNKLAPIGDQLLPRTLSQPKPDYYDGVRQSALDPRIRAELAPWIQPSTTSAPVAPNYACEIKAPEGSNAEAQRQARHDGAVLARGMQQLHSYSKGRPVYSGHAETLTTTYLKGAFNVFSHHSTQPSAPGQQPDYHMRLVTGTNPQASPADLARTVRYIRNSRDWTASRRERAVDLANRKLRADDRSARLRGKGVAAAEYEEAEENAEEDTRNITEEETEEDEEEDDRRYNSSTYPKTVALSDRLRRRRQR